MIRAAADTRGRVPLFVVNSASRRCDDAFLVARAFQLKGKGELKVRRVLLLVAAFSLGLFAAAPAMAAPGGSGGNGAPSGQHYNLNLIGFANGQNVKTTTGSGGNVIFVPLFGNCKIDLTEGSFGVLDNNCSDQSDALFQLPNPDPTNSGTSTYSVFAAARGKPLGSATANTCFTDTSTSTQYCSSIVMQLSRSFGQDKYSNVTKYLLYSYACIGGTIQRVPLFSDQTSDWYWQYDNNGLRNASLRFYPGVQTTVPSGGASC